jgi:predicted PurR-regulated permease PerM
MCFVAGFAFLFLGAAAWNLFHGDTEDASIGFIIGVVLAVFAFAMAREEKETQEFLAFLVENEERLKAGTSVEYGGRAISSGTEVTQFYACVSFLILTTKIPSRFFIRGSHNTAGIGLIYSLVTLVFGWWGVPWGPIYTIQSLYKNMRGGEKRPISQLLTEIEKVEKAESNTQQIEAKQVQDATAPSKSPWS